ncbi:MFS transporter permease [Microbacterium aureliae]
MVIRRLLFAWLLPAAVALPLWLFIGWAVTGAGGWALLWVLLAVPGVLVWQLLVTLLIRARGTVRARRAVSWADAAGVLVWHVLVVALGFFHPDWWALTMVGAVLAGLGLFWSSLAQLWREARPTGLVAGVGRDGLLGAVRPAGSAATADVIVVTESRGTPPR